MRYLAVFGCFLAICPQLFGQVEPKSEWEETPWQEAKPSQIEPFFREEFSPEFLIPPPEVVENKKENDNYRLRIGDTLMISIYGEPRSKRIVTVDPTGTISYSYLSSVNVLGKTIREMRAEVEELLKTYYREPVVSITPMSVAGAYYTIMGEVRAPGNKPITGFASVLSALCEAGGVTTRMFRNQAMDMADLEHSFLARRGEYIPVDFVRLIKDGDLTQDVPLQSGDFIYISGFGNHQVFVLGNVAMPTIIDFLQDISLTEALAEAGGVGASASSRVVVLRGALAAPEHYLIDINLILKGRAPDFPLQAGDIVFAPAMKFTSIKELVKFGIASFIGTLASVAGTKAYIGFNPDAAGKISPPATVINFNPTSLNFGQ